jgi:Zn-dependent peptidase ImmA (M78 family)
MNRNMTDKRLEWLEGLAHAAGITIIYKPLRPDLKGYYTHSKCSITVSSQLTTAHTVGTLAHELMHALHNHEGPQPDSVEARVDRMAARLLVSPSEYAEAERLYGPHAGAIAKELDLPLWVVRAWQAQAHPMRLASSASRCSEECW